MQTSVCTYVSVCKFVYMAAYTFRLMGSSLVCQTAVAVQRCVSNVFLVGIPCPVMFDPCVVFVRPMYRD